MSCSSGSCTCGFVYKNKVRNSQASPSPQLLPTTPLQAADPLLVGGMCACGGWVGQVVVRKMEGGGEYYTARPAPEEAAAGTATEPFACLCYSPSPFHHPFLPPIPAAPKPSSYHPTPPPPLQFRVAGAPGFPQSLTGPGEGEGHRNGRDWVPHCNQVQGALGKSKNGLFFLPITAVGGVGAGEVRFHTSFLFLPRPPPPPTLAVTPSAAGRCWSRRGETPDPDSAAV